MGELDVAVLVTVLGASVVIVVVAGTCLARIGDEIAEHTGLGRVFVGALFVAIATPVDATA